MLVDEPVPETGDDDGDIGLIDAMSWDGEAWAVGFFDPLEQAVNRARDAMTAAETRVGRERRMGGNTTLAGSYEGGKATL